MGQEIILEQREVNYLKMLLDNDLFLDRKDGVDQIVLKKQELFRKVEAMAEMTQTSPLKIVPVVIVDAGE